ncbi:hypothetical protein C0J52_27940 [Blattella germanica]|nr:hypothetical protein C0J52_27940 [Blattella germanica]
MNIRMDSALKKDTKKNIKQVAATSGTATHLHTWRLDVNIPRSTYPSHHPERERRGLHFGGNPDRWWNLFVITKYRRITTATIVARLTTNREETALEGGARQRECAFAKSFHTSSAIDVGNVTGEQQSIGFYGNSSSSTTTTSESWTDVVRKTHKGKRPIIVVDISENNLEAALESNLWPSNACVRRFFSSEASPKKTGLTRKPLQAQQTNATSLNSEETNLKIFTLNVQSLNNKLHFLDVILNEGNYTAFCVTEHWYNSVSYSFGELHGYNFAAIFCRKIFLHGGAGIYLKTNMKYQTIALDHFCQEEHFEACEFILTDYKLILISIYRSPCGDANIFLSSLENLLIYLDSYNLSIVLNGDVNLDVNVKSTITTEFCNILRSSN